MKTERFRPVGRVVRAKGEDRGKKKGYDDKLMPLVKKKKMYTKSLHTIRNPREGGFQKNKHGNFAFRERNSRTNHHTRP